jgi:transcriptional regulator with XRE-family HTH domain
MANISDLVGDNIKRIREEQGLSLENLSQLSGVSKSMLGQIERHESSPSINVLWKITEGLKVSFDVITSEPNHDITKIKIKKPIKHDGGQFLLYPIITYSHTHNFEIYRAEVESQGRYLSQGHTKGSKEYITVYKGGITILVDGNYHYVDRGETLIISSDKPHEYINDSLIKTEFSMTIIYK